MNVSGWQILVVRDGDGMEKMKKEGFSLVEMLIAISITSVVMLTMIGLLGYGANSMKVTQAKVALQEQAKDSLNHMAVYVQESTDAAWDDTTHTDCDVLVLMRKGIKNDGNEQAQEVVRCEDVYYYWYMPATKTVYFASRKTLLQEQGAADPEYDMTSVVTVTNDKKHMLVEKVQDMEAEIVENADTKNKTVSISMKLKDDISEYNCKREMNMRNQ